MSEVTCDYKWVTSHFNDNCNQCKGIIYRGEDALYRRGNIYCKKCATNVLNPVRTCSACGNTDTNELCPCDKCDRTVCNNCVATHGDADKPQLCFACEVIE